MNISCRGLTVVSTSGQGLYKDTPRGPCARQGMPDRHDLGPPSDLEHPQGPPGWWLHLRSNDRLRKEPSGRHLATSSASLSDSLQKRPWGNRCISQGMWTRRMATATPDEQWQGRGQCWSGECQCPMPHQEVVPLTHTHLEITWAEPSPTTASDVGRTTTRSLRRRRPQVFYDGQVPDHQSTFLE